MVDNPFPDDVREYVIKHVDSIAQMEALLLLRAEPDQSWDILSMARRLYISEPEVSDALARLIDGGLVSFEQRTFRYKNNPELQPLIDRVTAAYRRHFAVFARLIHDKPSRIQQFADAFRFRRDR